MIKQMIYCDVEKEINKIIKSKSQCKSSATELETSDFTNELDRVHTLLQDVMEKMNAIRRPTPYDPYPTVFEGPKWKVFLKRFVRKMTWWFVNRLNVLQHWNNEMTSASVQTLSECCSILMNISISRMSEEKKIINSLEATIDDLAKQIAGMKTYIETVEDRHKDLWEEKFKMLSDRCATSQENAMANCENIKQKLQEDLAHLSEDLKLQTLQVKHTQEYISVLQKEKEERDNEIQKTDIGNYVDYYRFEQIFRGSEDVIKDRIRRYLQYFRPGQHVLDIGCGRGEWLELLSENGIIATGVDFNPKVIEVCQVKQLSVIKEDMFTYLESLEDASLDGITSLQVIEHITPGQLAYFLTLCYRKMKTGGTLILETQNPAVLITMTNNFYVDPTHIRPVHPSWLKYIVENTGFSDVHLDYPDYSVYWDMMQAYPTVAPEQENDFKRRVDALNGLLFGPTDYAAIGKKA